MFFLEFRKIDLLVLWGRGRNFFVSFIRGGTEGGR